MKKPTRKPKPAPHAAHTEEPWHTWTADSKDYELRAERKDVIHHLGDIHDYANARRIVACVNACAGIPTEALEGAKVADLATALRRIMGNILPPNEGSPKGPGSVTDNWRQAQAILAKFEGK